jgi:hypothetical protein
MMTIFWLVPDLRVLAELALEHADGARAAHVVRHEHVGVHPDIVAGLDRAFAGGTGENFSVSVIKQTDNVAGRCPGAQTWS